MNEQLIKEQAIKALREGKKVTHRYFTDEEFIEQKGGYYYDENGYQMDIEAFWYYKRNASFEDGWSIYNN